MRFSILAIVTTVLSTAATFTNAAIVPRGPAIARLDSRHFEDTTVDVTHRDVQAEYAEIVARRNGVERRHPRDFGGEAVYPRVAEPVMEVRDITPGQRDHVRDFRSRAAEEAVAKRVVEDEVVARDAAAIEEIAGRAHVRDFRAAVEIVTRAIEEGRDIVEINDAIAKRVHARDFKYAREA